MKGNCFSVHFAYQSIQMTFITSWVNKHKIKITIIGLSGERRKGKGVMRGDMARNC